MQGLNDLDRRTQSRDLHKRAATCAAKPRSARAQRWNPYIDFRPMSGVLVFLLDTEAVDVGIPPSRLAELAELGPAKPGRLSQI
jgi:hypothetical protein